MAQSFARTIKYMLFLLLRKIAYVAAGIVDPLFHRSSDNVIVLCYHAIAHDDWRFSVDPEVFKRQIDYLLTVYTPITIEDLKAHINGTRRITRPSFLLNFDDGYEDVLQVKEFLRERGIRPTMFVLADTGHANRGELTTARNFLSTEQIHELKSAGWDIGCHSATHADLAAIDSEQIHAETAVAKDRLESELGFPVRYFAYPKGNYTPEVLAALEASGYELGLSMEADTIRQGSNPFIVPRIGIDRTHSFEEFKLAASPFIVRIRKIFNALIVKIA